MPYQVTLIHPDGYRRDWTQPKAPDWQQLRDLIGGYIEAVPHFKKFEGRRRGTCFVDEEGLIKNRPYNELATAAWLENLGKGPFRYEPRLHGPAVFYSKIKAQAPLTV